MLNRYNFKINVFLQVAKTIATLSRCQRLKVGAVITTEDFRVISTGYNGHRKNMIHTNCNQKEPGLCDCIHREQNRMLFGGHYYDLKNKKIFLTHSPCFQCRKLIAQFGIKHLFYINEYRDKKPLQYLLLNQIIVERNIK